MFILMSTWMNEKKLMKQYYLKKNYRNLNVEDITDTDYTHAKRVSKDDIKKFK